MSKKTPAPVNREDTALEAKSSGSDIGAFLKAAQRIGSDGEGRGRLIFALDATMSRQPTWDRACHIQEEMFREAGAIGSLDIQLVYFRGFGECAASKWASDGKVLGGLMRRIDCQGGHTQIGKVLSHARKASQNEKISALVYVGDCMEESADELCERAGELGLLGVPAFVFQEGSDRLAETTFREIARLTKGAYCRFDTASAQLLAQLLKAVAVYAVGGRKALADYRGKGGDGARLLLQQFGDPS